MSISVNMRILSRLFHIGSKQPAAQQLVEKPLSTSPILEKVQKIVPLADKLPEKQWLQDKECNKPREVLGRLLNGEIGKEEAVVQLGALRTALLADNQSCAAEICGIAIEFMDTGAFSYFKSKDGVTVFAAISPSQANHKYIIASDSVGNLYLAIQPTIWGEHRTIVEKMEKIAGKELTCDGSRYYFSHLLTSAEEGEFNAWLSKLSDSQKASIASITKHPPLIVEAEGSAFLVLLNNGAVNVARLKSPKTGGGAIKFHGTDAGALSGKIMVHDYSHGRGQGPNEVVARILSEGIFPGKGFVVGLPNVNYTTGSDIHFSQCQLILP